VARLSSHTCDRILFVSEDSAAWIGDALRIPAQRRAVVHHGIDVEGWTRSGVGSPHWCSYILSVSSIYRYKNFVRLIEAYTALARRLDHMPDLVIIGDDQDREYSQKMQRARAAAGSELAEQIHILGEVPYADIKAYYSAAALFVFPSYRETFGHPLLEAMASGVPTVAADLPVFHEIAGDAAFYADPHQPESLAGAIEAALFAPGAREILIKRARERVRAFGWDAAARRLSSLFDEIR
jgi:glycosyltransferase involved in cell wall biosynthesis